MENVTLFIKMDIESEQREKKIIPLEKQKHSKVKIFIILAILVSGSFFVWLHSLKKEQLTIIGSEKHAEENFSEELEKNVVTHTVSEGDIPAEVFFEFGKLDANEMEALLAASEGIYDFTKIKVGQNLEFIFNEKEKAEKIRYYPDAENVILIQRNEEKFTVKKETIPYEIKEENLNVKIDEFLYKDALDAGLSEATILEVADVFSFDIDFTTEIQAGDEMKIFFEKRTLKGKLAPDGKILAAKFINSGQEYFAYYFESDGKSGYYDAEGHELMRQFLRAPLSYRKITSGYTGSRFHPITKKVTAHYQIDYAAPTGTPVVSTAEGTISSANWEGGWGNMVRIAHNNGFTTHYGHLSAFGKGVKSGVSISQGQVIGYVGSTGWSTGPHLDYGMKLNGNPVNPLSLKLPKGAPLEGEKMKKFQELKRKYEGLLK